MDSSSWATVLIKNKCVHSDGALDFHPPAVSGSKIIVKITADDVSCKWNSAVIAQILGDNDPSLESVKKFAEKKWNNFGLLQVQKLDNELFIFRFKSEESKNRVLGDESLVFYGSKMMYLRPWVPSKPIEKLTLKSVPIWIKLPGLGLQYFTLQALSKLGSLIGKPLFADKETIDQSILSYARMCVVINADDDEKLTDVLVYQNEFGVDVVQDVVYEWVPPRCGSCKLFGHDTSLCTKHNAEGDNHDDEEFEKVDKKVGLVNYAGDSHDDEEFEKVEINSEYNEFYEEDSSKDEEISDEIQPHKKVETRISRNTVCPCGSKKRYKYCCESVAKTSSCSNEGESLDKKSLLPEEEKKVSKNEPCPCGSEKKYKRCCGKSLKEKKKRCPCGSTKKYRKCCGAAADESKQKNQRNKRCHCGSSKKLKQCCGAKDPPSFDDEWVVCPELQSGFNVY